MDQKLPIDYQKKKRVRLWGLDRLTGCRMGCLGTGGQGDCTVLNLRMNHSQCGLAFARQAGIRLVELELAEADVRRIRRGRRARQG